MANRPLVVTHGIGQVNRSFRKIDRALEGELRSRLKKIVEPVAETAQGRIGRFPGAVTSTIQPVTSTRSVFVRQKQGKRGGGHPQFGSLQMVTLIAAMYEHEDEIEPALEDMLDELTTDAGFSDGRLF